MWDFVLWDVALWDFIRRDFVRRDFVLWDSVRIPPGAFHSFQGSSSFSYFYDTIFIMYSIQYYCSIIITLTIYNPNPNLTLILTLIHVGCQKRSQSG